MTKHPYIEPKPSVSSMPCLVAQRATPSALGCRMSKVPGTGTASLYGCFGIFERMTKRPYMICDF
jgi:hypothetical protein